MNEGLKQVLKVADEMFKGQQDALTEPKEGIPYVKQCLVECEKIGGAIEKCGRSLKRVPIDGADETKRTD